MKEKIKAQKGFIPISLLAAITIGLFLSYGVGYGLNVNKKINKELEEAQQLVVNEKYDEANNVLDELQNNWLIKNLNFKKGQISEIKLTIEKVKYKTLEEKLITAEAEKEESEKRVEEEGSRRIAAEVMQKSAEAVKTSLEKELFDVAQKEKELNEDKDGDGLTLREELQLGTSDLNKDSDNDGIPDKEDSHPAGGGRLIAQHFEWNYGDKKWTWDLSFPSDRYDFYKNKKHGAHSADYVTFLDPHIIIIASKLKEVADREGFSRSEFATAFIQSLDYVGDEIIGYDDFPKYPLETLAEQNGDCEDTSYLATSIITAMGIDCVLVVLPNHMAIAVAYSGNPEGYYYKMSNAKNYYYIETTAEGWSIGEIPDQQYKYIEATLIKIPDNSFEELVPNYIPFTTCFVSSASPGYYYDREGKWYYDSNCSQPVVAGCYKSTSYPGYYYSGANYYRDSRCSIYTSCLPSLLYSGYFYDGYFWYSDNRCLNKVYFSTTTQPPVTTTTSTTTTTIQPPATTTTTTTTTQPPTTTTSTTTTTEPPTTTTTQPPVTTTTTTTTTEPPTTTTIEP